MGSIHTCGIWTEQLPCLFLSRLQVRIRNFNINLKIALLTHHTSVSVNCLSMSTCVCVRVLILRLLPASDGCHSRGEMCITNSPETHSAAYSFTSSALSSSDEELRQWFQWSTGIKTAGVVVTFYDCWQAESTHLFKLLTWQRHTWLI